MAYLKDEVKFPGMNQMLADRDAQKKESENVAFKKDGEETDLDLELVEKSRGGDKEVPKLNKKSMLEKQDLTWSGVANKFVEKFKPANLLKESLKAEEQEQKNIIAQQNKLDREAKRSGTLKEREEGLGGGIIKPTVPEPVDWNVLYPVDSKESNDIKKNLGNSSLEKVFTNIPTVNENGEELRPEERAMVLYDRLQSTIRFKLSNNIAIWGEPTDQEIYGGVKKGVTEAEKRSAAEIIKDKIKKFENLEHLKLRQSGKDGGEWGVAWNKIKALGRASLAFVETKLLDTPLDYKGPGGYDYIEAEIAKLYASDKLNIGTISDGKKVEPDAIKASMISSAPTYEIDPASLTSEQQKQQAYSHTIKHEDPDLSGRVIDDNKRAILGGSVDAWGIVGGDIESGRNVIMDVLKIKDQAKMKAFVQYFNTKDLDEHLGHIKKGKPALTPTQLDRRRLLKLTSDQTKALVTWAYDKNLNTLTNSHGFLNQEVYENNPSLHQLLGDMAYRHGGSFMTRTKAGYKGLANAIDHALNPTKDYSRDDAITDMNRLLFKQGTYSKKKEQGNARYAFLQDRFNRFKDNTAGVNVAYKGKAGPNITLVDGTPKYKKNINSLLTNPNLVNPSTLRLPELTLTGL
jgi:hypothetical protein